MFLLLLALSLCTLATFMLLFKVGAKWFAAVSFAGFAFTLLGGERISFTFAHEYDDFFRFTFYYFMYLSIYFTKVPKEPVYVSGVLAKRFPNRPLFISAALIIFGFGAPIYLYGVANWRQFSIENWALIVLSFYMGVVGIILFKRAWRVRRLRLELQKSLGKH